MMKCIGVKSGCSHGRILKVFFWFSHGLPRGSLFYLWFNISSGFTPIISPSIQPSASKLVRNIQGLPDLRFVAAFVKTPVKNRDRCSTKPVTKRRRKLGLDMQFGSPNEMGITVRAPINMVTFEQQGQSLDPILQGLLLRVYEIA